MENQLKTIKSVIPNLIRQFSDFIQVDVTIKLFGVKVFSFTWPPKSNPYVEPQND